MKKLGVLLLILALLSGCTTQTNYGKCIGLGDERDPALVYKLSAWNIFLGIIFVETVIVPLVVIIDNTYCPVNPR